MLSCLVTRELNIYLLVDCPSNKFGPYCKYSCSPNCERDCNDVDGRCFCKPGFRDDDDELRGLLCNNRKSFHYNDDKVA